MCPLLSLTDISAFWLIAGNSKLFFFSFLFFPPESSRSGSWKWATETKDSQRCLNLCLFFLPPLPVTDRARVSAGSQSGARSFAVTSTRLQDGKMTIVVSTRWMVAKGKQYSFYKVGVWGCWCSQDWFSHNESPLLRAGSSWCCHLALDFSPDCVSLAQSRSKITKPTPFLIYDQSLILLSNRVNIPMFKRLFFKRKSCLAIARITLTLSGDPL